MCDLIVSVPDHCLSFLLFNVGGGGGIFPTVGRVG